MAPDEQVWPNSTLPFSNSSLARRGPGSLAHWIVALTHVADPGILGLLAASLVMYPVLAASAMRPTAYPVRQREHLNGSSTCCLHVLTGLMKLVFHGRRPIEQSCTLLLSSGNAAWRLCFSPMVAARIAATGKRASESRGF